MSGVVDGEGLGAGMTGPEVDPRLSFGEFTHPENSSKLANASVIRWCLMNGFITTYVPFWSIQYDSDRDDVIRLIYQQRAFPHSADGFSH